jgi:hypothetical protein
VYNELVKSALKNLTPLKGCFFTMRNSHKLNVWLALFTLTLVAMLGIGTWDHKANAVNSMTITATPLQISLKPFSEIKAKTLDSVCPPTCDPLFKLVEESFENRYIIPFNTNFIVKLKIQFENESTLSEEQRSAQQKAILDLQQKVKTTFSQRSDLSYAGFGLGYHWTPYVLLTITNPDTLKFVVSHPDVERVHQFDPTIPAALLGFDQIYIKLENGDIIAPSFSKKSPTECIPLDLCKALANGTYNNKYFAVEMEFGTNLERYNSLFESSLSLFKYRAKVTTFNELESFLMTFGGDRWSQDYSVFVGGSPSVSMILKSLSYNSLINSKFISKITIGELPDSIVAKKISVESYPTQTIINLIRPNPLIASPNPGQNRLQMGIPTDFPYKGAEKAIAIIDDGVLSSHPSLSGRVATARGDIKYCHIDNNQSPYDKCKSDVDTNPCYPLNVTATAYASLTPTSGGVTPTPIVLTNICGHGTWISGPVVGSVNGVRDTVAIAPSSMLVPFRMSNVKFHNPWEFLNKMELALDNVNALNSRKPNYIMAVTISVGIPMEGEENNSVCDDIYDIRDNHPYKQMSYIKESIRELRKNGVITFVAAGSYHLNGKPDFPGCLSDVISVSSVDPKDQIEHVTIGDLSGGYNASNSGVARYRPTFVNNDPGNELDLLATGYGYGTDVLNRTLYSGGGSTSMAAPQAAAAFALYRERYSSLNPERVLQIFLADANQAKVPDPRVVPVSISGTIVATLAKTVIPNVALMVKPETGRVDFKNLLAGAKLYPNVNYDSPSSTGASVTPPLSCDYLAAGQDCTLREAVAAALPQDVIGFSEEQLYRATLFIEANPILIDKPVTIDGGGRSVIQRPSAKHADSQSLLHSCKM